MRKHHKKKNLQKNKTNELYNFQKDLLKYLFLFFSTFLIFEIFFHIDSRLTINLNNTKHIFTFWEPSRKLPGYLKLCIKTWKKFLPEYEIIIIDYNNIYYFLERKLISKILFKKMSLPIQADAIRVAILKKYGGIWMDADTIILNREFLKEIKGFELVMFGDHKNKTQNIGFIYATKNSSIINDWLNMIINNVNLYKQSLMIKHYMKNINNSKLKIFRDKVNSWNFLGNGIIDPLLEKVTGPKFFRLDKYKMNIFPEIKFFENTFLDYRTMYQKYYFQKGEPKEIINNTKGIILLHNSWTPKKYQRMTDKRFLKQDIILSKLLALTLNISI